jgi:hypothetical protein
MTAKQRYSIFFLLLFKEMLELTNPRFVALALNRAD